MRTIVGLVGLSLVLVAGDASARTLIFPHLIESDGRVTVDPGSFDTQIFLTYVGGLPGAAARTGQTAEVSLYVYDEATGLPLVSVTAQEVCNPCLFTLAGEPAARKRTVVLHDEIVARGGFASPFYTAFAIVIVGGDETNVAVAGAIVNAKTGPTDLSIVPLEPTPIGAASLGGGGR